MYLYVVMYCICTFFFSVYSSFIFCFSSWVKQTLTEFCNSKELHNINVLVISKGVWLWTAKLKTQKEKQLQLLKPVLLYCVLEQNENAFFVLSKHGGHLGFFEGNLLHPDPVTWIDKLIVQYFDSVINLKTLK